MHDSEYLHENEFWETPPRYSDVGAAPMLALSIAPRSEPSRLRRVMAKLLFVTAFSAVLALLIYEVSIVFGISLSDVQSTYTRLAAALH